MTVFWLIICIVTIIAETMTLAMVSIWFTAGAFAAMVCSFFGAPEMVQTAVFLAVSVAALAIFKTKGERVTSHLQTPTNADRFIGREGLVIKTIDACRDEGLVTVDGQEWSARPMDKDAVIAEGSRVVVKEIRGVKLLVEKKEEDKT